MKTNAKKELIVLTIVLLLLGFTLNQTYATNTITNANEILNLVSGGNTNNLTNENATQIPEGQNTNINTNKNININTNKNANVNRNATNKNINNANANKNELPDTGLESPSIVIVAICLISAVYAYKKIRDYKNI